MDQYNEDPLILIVDDNPTNIDILVNTLQSSYRLGVAKNGENALKYARRNHPQLILLDVMMPGMNGFEVCKTLKASLETRDISIIFITALHDSGNITKGLQMGAVDFVTKPFNPEEIKARVRAHVTIIEYKERLEKKVARRTLRLEEANRQLREIQVQIIRKLGKAAEYRDNETGLHVIRVSIYSGYIAESLGLLPETTEMIRLCAPMHDLGKIGIPDEILLKKGPLNEREWEITRTHCQIGADILSPEFQTRENASPRHNTIKEVINHVQNPLLLNTSTNIAAFHHERWDGKGYPYKKKGEEIPIEARIVAVADVYDTLSSERSYKEVFPENICQESLREMSGKNFEPKIVHAFFESIDRVLKTKERLKDQYFKKNSAPAFQQSL